MSLISDVTFDPGLLVDCRREELEGTGSDIESGKVPISDRVDGVCQSYRVRHCTDPAWCNTCVYVQYIRGAIRTDPARCNT